MWPELQVTAEWVTLLKKSLNENFIFLCAVNVPLHQHLNEHKKDFQKEHTRGVLRNSLSKYFKKLQRKDARQGTISPKLEDLSL